MKGRNNKALKDEFTHFLLEDEFTSSKKNDSAQNQQVTNQPNAKPNVQLAEAQASLKQSEILRAAQNRIAELEKQVVKLRNENEQLTATGIVFQNKYDEVKEKLENYEKSLKLNQSTSEEEKAILEKIVEKNNVEKSALEQKVLELKERLQEKFNAMKIRERELENRLELLKAEEQVVMGNKDQIILDLKYKIDQLEVELETTKLKNKDVSLHITAHKDQIRRTVKALRLALTMLEGENPSDSKKTGTE